MSIKWEPMDTAPRDDALRGIEVLLSDGSIEHAAWFAGFGDPAWRDMRCPERILNPTAWRRLKEPLSQDAPPGRQSDLPTPR
jgi:hypothetical protein